MGEVDGHWSLSVHAAMERVVDRARDLTGARYAALGILNIRRTELEELFTAGLNADVRRAIGILPRGRGVLGALIEHAKPVRLIDVGQDSRSYGFPAGHPVIRGFLGVPVMIGGKASGNLYVANRASGEFTEADEAAVVALAGSAARTIEAARSRDADPALG